MGNALNGDSADAQRKMRFDLTELGGIGHADNLHDTEAQKPVVPLAHICLAEAYGAADLTEGLTPINSELVDNIPVVGINRLGTHIPILSRPQHCDEDPARR